jgi:hypothetical protein
MRYRNHRVGTRAAALLGAAVAMLVACAPAQAACDFAVVKQQIDVVLERDAEKFRREVRAGTDSLEAVNSLVTAQMREKIDICRFEASEYLAKRGFPPGGH